MGPAQKGLKTATIVLRIVEFAQLNVVMASARMVRKRVRSARRTAENVQPSAEMTSVRPIKGKTV